MFCLSLFLYILLLILLIFYCSGVELGLNPLEISVVGFILVSPFPSQLLKLCFSNKLLLSISPVIAASSNIAIGSPRFLNRKYRGFFSVDYFLIQKVMNKQ